MGILGTSASEEAALRSAISNGSKEDLYNSRRQSESSDYLTADDESNDIADAQPHPTIGNELGSNRNSKVDNDNASTSSTIKASREDAGTVGSTKKDAFAAPSNDLSTTHSHESSVKEFQGMVDQQLDEEDEDELNRKFTLERISTRRTIEEMADEELSRQITSHSNKSNQEKDVIHAKDLAFDSPDDPANPQNWPQWKKWYITFTVAGICLCVSLGSSLYVSGVREITEVFNVSQELAISGLTFYLIGLACGPIIAAPLSEIIGRKWIYFLGIPISMLFTMGVGLSPNIQSILVLRFFCGFFASPALAVAGGSISDIWAPEEMGFAMAMFCLAPFLGPILGPIIGNFAAASKGWKFPIWVTLMFYGLILIPVITLPETYKAKILADRAKKRGFKVFKPSYSAKALFVATVGKPMKMLVLEPIVLIFSVYIAFVFAVLFGFFEAFPIIFLSVYKMEQGVSGLPFIGVGVGLMLGVVFYVVLDKFYYFKKNPDGTRGKRDENGNMIWDPPETRLLLGQIGSIFLPISLFWLGWTSRESIHWICPTLSGIFFGFGLILVFFMCMLYFSMAFPPLNVASALAANNLLRYILASVFPLFTVQMYQRLGIDWASSLFAFIALAMVPVPFVFGKYGPALRAKSKYGYHAYFKALALEKAAKEAQASKTEKASKEPENEKSMDESNSSNTTQGEYPEGDPSHKV